MDPEAIDCSALGMGVATVRAKRSVLPRAYALDNAADLRVVESLSLQPRLGKTLQVQVVAFLWLRICEEVLLLPVMAVPRLD